jgi:hypothetical protein
MLKGGRQLCLAALDVMNLTRAALAIVLCRRVQTTRFLRSVRASVRQAASEEDLDFREQLHEHFRENMLQDQDLVERNCAELRAWPKWKTRGMWIRPRSTSAGAT